MSPAISFFLASISIAAAVVLPRQDITLAVSPVCATLGGAPGDINVGLPPLSSFSTIVTFGDSYTDGGVHDGSALGAPVLDQPNPFAGGRYTNGPVWAEYLANVAGATLKDYAMRGAVVATGQWPSLTGTKSSDLLTQANTFISQAGPRPAADSTLYVLFFGIEDYVLSHDNGDSDLSNPAGNIAFTILRLASSPVFGKNFLIIDNHGRGTETTAGANFKAEVFQSLASLRDYGLNVGFVDLSTVWDGVLGSSPGYQAFGYTSTSACLASTTTTDGSCADPDHAFYWFPGAPTTATHKIISDYIQAVWKKCQGYSF
ncbi:carbohydrate esterase family 16 protein [Macrolepiota fuliginosa MF-IS2]|uniref:Carbohydrate esterase family 16 protein n=1 Tax=Macrolepiota fuliginosa MF-IS2 TaxID=1400762 RepID=A0A9P5X5H9_9AGAR|nr:carbohydrate esterase family 16 protein [Macrolepiota fuliginosa MF-IS2]